MTRGSAIEIRDEFDRLAPYSAGSDANDYHHARLFRALPARIGTLLDAGCGTGSFARAIAPRCGRVVAIDLSPRMIERAKTEGMPSNVELAVGDVMSAELPPEGFDAIVSIAALHHMEARAAFQRFATLLRPGGTLAILDLYAASGSVDRALWMISAALAPPMRWLRTGRLFPSREVRAAWALHEAHDHYATIPDLEAVTRDVLPGSVIRRQLFWRYSLVWTKRD